MQVQHSYTSSTNGLILRTHALTLSATEAYRRYSNIQYCILIPRRLPMLVKSYCCYSYSSPPGGNASTIVGVAFHLTSSVLELSLF